MRTGRHHKSIPFRNKNRRYVQQGQKAHKNFKQAVDAEYIELCIAANCKNRRHYGIQSVHRSGTKCIIAQCTAAPSTATATATTVTIS